MPSKKSTGLTNHTQKICDCFDGTDPEIRSCIYATFPDNWSFVPERGLGQSSGEVFTPLIAVNKMITSNGLFDKDSIYHNMYQKISAEKLQQAIYATVIEPAVGTGNYISTVLYHKLKYVEALYDNRTQKLDLFHELFLTAVGSIYAYDIDVGNIETTKRRLLSHGKQSLNDYKSINYWVEHIDNVINGDDINKHNRWKKVQPIEIQGFVESSLNDAHKFWYAFTKTGIGVIDAAYRSILNERLPEWLYWQCREILDKNFKLFDGLNKHTSLSDGMFVPGWEHVSWTKWEIMKRDNESIPFIRETMVPMKDIIENE